MAATGEVSRYPWRLVTRIAARIEHACADEAHRLVDQFLDRLDREHGRSLGPRKLRCGALLSHCLRGAHRGGAVSDQILHEHLDAIERLTKQRSWQAMRAFIHDYVDSLLLHVQPQRHTDVERLVDTIRADIRRSLESSRTLAEYAHEAGVSTEHLSRCFRARAGVPFREERRRLRMEAAVAMLEDTSLKVSAIAFRVGQRNTSRFIHDFKHETGLTPGAYRLQHQRSLG